MERPSELRSYTMRQVKSKNTAPELTVRKLLHRAGFRFRLHRDDLPGKPDIVLPKYRLAIFVHGCFWHRHPGCRRASTPATNQDYWIKKFARNTSNDAQNIFELHSRGWKTLILWECEVKSTLSSKEAIEKSVVRKVQAAARRSQLS